MLNKNLMKEAHKLTREIKAEYKDVDYKAQLGICISYLATKETTKELTEDTLEEAAVKAVEEFGADDYTWNKWEKNGNKRIYISLVWWKKRGGIKKEVKCGYLDLVTMEYVTENKYTRQYDLLTEQYV